MKLLKQGYRFNKLRKTFSKFYYRNLPLISKYKCNFKSFLRQGISHPEFYDNVIYKLRKIFGHVHFDNLFYKRIKSFLKKDYDRYIATHFTFGYGSLYSRQPCFSLRLCGDRKGLVLHDGVSLNLSPERYVGFSYSSISVIP